MFHIDFIRMIKPELSLLVESFLVKQKVKGVHTHITENL